MDRVSQLEEEIARLDPSELIRLREWFSRYDADLRDRQIESDAQHGKLARAAERALRDYDAGLTTEL
jgi:hypothetical protein